MITYRITSKSTSQEQSHTLDAKEQKLQTILDRAVKRAVINYPIGCTVELLGSKRRAEVLDIFMTVEKAHWKKLKPFFIRIKFQDNGQVVLTHGSSIRRKKT